MRRPVQTRSRRWSHAPSLLQSSKFRQVLRVSRITSGFPPHLIVYQEEEAQDGINPLLLDAAPVEERVNGPDGPWAPTGGCPELCETGRVPAARLGAAEFTGSKE